MYDDDKIKYYKIYNIQKQLLLVTPSRTNAEAFVSEFLEEDVKFTLKETKQHCFRGHILVEVVML